MFPYLFSIKSVLKKESPDEVILYYNHPIPQTQKWNYIYSLPITVKEFNLDDFRFPFLKDSFYENIRTFIEPHRYRGFNLSDLARYLILYKYGGVYSDLDCVTLKSIKPVIQDANAFIPTCATKTCILDGQLCYFANGNLGSCPEQQFFKEVLLECEKILEHLISINHNGKTAFGPHTLFPAYQRCKEVLVLDYKIFHSIGHTGKSASKTGFFYQDVYDRMCDIPQEAHVLHFHTGKSRSSMKMHLYKQPYNIRRKKDRCTFAASCFEFIDEHMENHDWG